ncbi:MAG TPA: hypothetical protein DCZ87_06645, partial [Chitinophagaceae bacterium]|nr:hypothetical protein [Chitinophagaceae bacterium]
MRIHYLFTYVMLLIGIAAAATPSPQHPGTQSQSWAMTKSTVQQRNEPTGNYIQVVELLKRLNKEQGIYFLLADPSIARLMVKEPNTGRPILQVVEDIASEAGLVIRKVGDNTFVLRLANKTEGAPANTGLSQPEEQLIR